MKKRILAVIMAVCVSMTALPADVHAAEDGAAVTESTQVTETSAAKASEMTEKPDGTETSATGKTAGTEKSETGNEASTETAETETEETETTVETETSETETAETETTVETETVETETAETETTVETETAETETAVETESVERKSAETENTETGAVREAELNYMMVESAYVETPGTQNVVLSLGTGNEQLSDVILNYQNVTTGKSYQVKAAGTEEDMIRFTMDFSKNGQAGEYQITSVQFTQDKTGQEILLSDLGMDVRFGVNEQTQTNPDQVLYDEDAYADVDADVVTMNEKGEIVSQNTVENVLDQGISDAVIGGTDRLKGANGKVTVVLDPGHDDTHAGASGFGVQEKDLTLKIATYCKEELSAYSGITIYMTRESGSCPAGGGDNTACLDARANLAKNVGASAFVSFHLNTANGTARGVEVYYPNSNYNAQVGSNGQALAKKICDKLAALGLNYRGTMIRNATTDKYPDGSAADYYGLIRRCKNNGIPGLIIEHAFLDNANDYYTYLSSDDKLKALGVADATAIAEYFGLKKGAGSVSISYAQSRADGSIKLKWSSLDNVDCYEIWRDTKDAYDYAKIDEVSDATSYIDKTVETGIKYYYLVRPVFNDGTTGEFSGSFSGVALGRVKLTGAVAKSGREITLNWKKVSNAEGYLIYRKDSSNGKFSQVGKVTSGKTLTYTDTVKSSKKTYTYKVQAYNTSNGKQGVGAFSETKSAKTLAKPKIKYAISNGSNQIEVNWGAVSGAYGYRIKRSTSKDGTYKVVATVKGKNKTTYQDKKLEAGKTYYYKVETINKVNGKKGYSGDSAAVSAKTLKKTSITAAQATGSTSVKLEWKAVDGASGYQIYRSTSKSKGYIQIGQVKGKNKKVFEDKSLETGKTYYYQVRAYKSGSTKTGVASFSKAQKVWTIKPAEFSQITSDNKNQVSFVWKKVSKAEGYAIYRSSKSDSGFQKIAEITSGKTLTYTDETVTSGSTYYYKIAAVYTIKGSAGESCSDAVQVTVLDQGSISSITLGDNIVLNISWGTVGNADGYELAGAVSENGTYTTLQTSGAKSFTHSNLTQGTTYYYKVRAYKDLNNEIRMYGPWSEVKSKAAAHEIMGTSSVTVDQMVSYYNKRYTFPADTYRDKGADSAEAFFKILKEEADAEGVRADLLFAQVMLETGGLTFGGDVQADQCNFGGLGAVGGGAAGETYADVRTGLRAQVQHLKAYASTDSLKNACVDTRFQYVSRGSARYVEWLAIPQNPSGKGWAADADYGTKLLRIMNSL